jgi:penicillin-binding protein 1B
MSENPQNFIQRIFGLGGNKPAAQPNQPNMPRAPQATRPYTPAPASNTPRSGDAPEQTPPPEAKPKKKNFFQRLFGGGGDNDKDKQSQSEAPPE